MTYFLALKNQSSLNALIKTKSVSWQVAEMLVDFAEQLEKISLRYNKAKDAIASIKDESEKQKQLIELQQKDTGVVIKFQLTKKDIQKMYEAEEISPEDIVAFKELEIYGETKEARDAKATTR